MDYGLFKSRFGNAKQGRDTSSSLNSEDGFCENWSERNSDDSSICLFLFPLFGWNRIGDDNLVELRVPDVFDSLS